MTNKILHFANNSQSFPNKFVPELGEELSENLNNSVHYFYFFGDDSGLSKFSFNYKIVDENYFKILHLISKADKVVFHTLPPFIVMLLLGLFCTNRRNIYLAFWGGELYDKHSRNGLKEKIYNLSKYLFLSRIPNYITSIKEDFELARKRYNCNAKHIDFSGFYPSNIINAEKGLKQNKQCLLLVGNSAMPRNRHDVAFELLKESRLSLSDAKIICPITYGDNVYAELLVSKWQHVFGKNLVFIREHIDRDAYNELLSQVDIAFLPNFGQQGLGNIRQLLAFGSTLYLEKNSVNYSYFKRLGFDILSIEEFDLDKRCDSERNKQLAINYFSKEVAKKNWIKFYEGDW